MQFQPSMPLNPLPNTSSHASTEQLEPSQKPSVGVREQLLRNDAHQNNGQPTAELVKWGISWKTPALMIVFLLSGVAFALGHHFYYMSLHGTPAGTKSRQQWATAFGTAFAFLVVALLKTAAGNAYQQYIWTVVKRKPLELGTLDRLFALTSDPTGIFHLSLIRNAQLAILGAAICCCFWPTQRNHFNYVTKRKLDPRYLWNKCLGL
ncbi:hypothetical protein LSUE1_G007466 [Lachnellula suecica]|uniref:Uncharacterized protein n=1 Tax=Lachnellula suecica TaxID=602035 RepID=A0A8T9BZ21_9HELO|nr:hypothetical protein LSUE1_G007466 [Lachnellula suecica]